MQWQCKGIYCWLVPLAVVEVEAASISLSTIRSLSPLSSLLSSLSPLSSLLSLQLGWGFFLDVRLWAGSREYDPCMYSSSSTGCCACSKPTVRSKRPELEATTNDVMLLVLQVASTSCHLLHGANGNVCQKLFSSTHSAFFSMHPSLIFPAVLSSLCTVGNHVRRIVSDMLISHVKGSRCLRG